LFFDLSSEFDWTPEQIRRLTFQELEIYVLKNHRLRRNIPDVEHSLDVIRQVLFAAFGIKEKRPARTEAEFDEKIKRLGGITITKSETKAWLDAGMPSPPQAFLKKYREKMKKENGN